MTYEELRGLQRLLEALGGSERLLRGMEQLARDTFRAYCANKPDLDGKSFVKLCKDCEIVDNSFTQIDADLIFAKVVSRGHRRITLHQFEALLTYII